MNDATPHLSPLLQGLNDEQLACVTLTDSHALVLAGAGSGKTRALTTRIAWLINQGFAGSQNILAVTFTNKAAREMQTRLSTMLNLNVRSIWMGTFHGLCHRLLKTHYEKASLPSLFQILDMQDQLSAIKRLCKLHQIDEEHFPPKQLQWFIAGCKDDGLRPQNVPAKDAQTRQKIELYHLYEEQCQREGVVDFGELMLRSFELLQNHPSIRAHYTARFRYILIDEFQDTSSLQYAWIKLLSGISDTKSEPSWVMAVGDDDQSIYAFRGAKVGNMQEFLHDFHVQTPIKLEKNYRSHSNILEAANALIGHNAMRLGKNLQSTREHGELIKVFSAANDWEEAATICQEIKALHHAGENLKEVAILYRSNAQSRVLEQKLKESRLAYRIYGGMRYFDRAEIKHALAYLRLVVNPIDDTSFMRAVNFPPRGIGLRSMEQLQMAAREHGVSLYAASSYLSGTTASKINAFISKIEGLKNTLPMLLPGDFVSYMLEESGLLEHYRSEKDGENKIENLEELINAVSGFVQQYSLQLTQSPVSQGLTLADHTETNAFQEVAIDANDSAALLAEFLNSAARDSSEEMAEGNDDAVQMMTVHAAKGLEFNNVFITGLEAGLFPHENSSYSHDGLEEERRLMYVAITRARKRLFLSFAQQRMVHGRTESGISPSQFLREIPEGLLNWLSEKPRAIGRAPGSNSSFDFLLDVDARQGSKNVSFNSPPAAAASPGPTDAIGVRQRVFHNKFGEGTVLELQGKGFDAKVKVHFSRHGTKLLVLELAKLVAID